MEKKTHTVFFKMKLNKRDEKDFKYIYIYMCV